MKNKVLKIVLVLILTLNVFFLSGCWDSRELKKLFIVIGSSLDLVENDEMKMTVQIEKTQTSAQNGTSQQSGTESSLILDAQNKSVLDAFMTINENCSRSLLFEHNQVLLFGESLAQRGISDVLDLFIRVQEARIETNVVIVEGSEGAEILKTKIDENKLSGQFAFQIINGLSLVSKYYQVRIIDLINAFLSESNVAVVPMIKLTQKNDKDVIEFSGMAILKDGKLVGKLNQEQVRGFVCANGSVKSLLYHGENEQGIVGYRIEQTKGKISVKPKSDNDIQVDINVNGELEVDEIMGFEDVEKTEIVDIIKPLVEEKLKQLIEQCIEISMSEQADIFGIADKIWKTNPKFWQNIENNWNELYEQVEFNINVNLALASFGDIIKSVDMEKVLREEENY